MSSQIPRIIIVFRNDDPSALCQVEKERAIFSVFADCRIPQTISVVPNMSRTDVHDPFGHGEAALDSNPAMVDFLREAVEQWGCEIALHGYTHRTHPRSLRGPKDYFEFYRRSAAEQATMIQAGLDIFQRALGLRPSTFVPPWNRLDAGTVAACEKLGFSTISAAEFLPHSSILIPFGVNTIPATFFAAFAQAKRNENRTFLHLMYHSPLMKEAAETMLLQQIVRTVADDPDCRAMTIDQASRDFGPELRQLNLAGRSISPFSEIQDSVRARAHLYVRGWKRVSPENRIEKIRVEAFKQYRASCYEGCLSLDHEMDRICSWLLWIGRFSALALGLASIWVLSLIFPIPIHLRLVALTLVFGLCGSAVLLRRFVRSDDTWREILWLAVFASLGVGTLNCHPWS
jgi:predicted deacetylase